MDKYLEFRGNTDHAWPPPPPSLGTRLMVILGTLRLHPPPTTPDSPAALQLPSILKINLAFNNHVWPMYTLVRTWEKKDT